MRTLLARWAGVTALAACLAGCGSSPATTTSGAVAPVASSADPGLVDVCLLLTAGQIKTLTGEAVGAGTETDEPSQHTYKCIYNVPSQIELDVMRPANASLFKAFSAAFGSPKPVGGLGDEAVYGKYQGVMARFGDTILWGTYRPSPREGTEPLDIDKGLVGALHTALQ